MTQKQAIAVLSEQQAVERLLERGWKKLPCANCGGKGFFKDLPETFLETDSPTGWSGYVCALCAGTGYTWEAPKP